MQKGWSVCTELKLCILSPCHQTAVVWCVGSGIHHDSSWAADKSLNHLCLYNCIESLSHHVSKNNELIAEYMGIPATICSSRDSFLLPFFGLACMSYTDILPKWFLYNIYIWGGVFVLTYRERNIMCWKNQCCFSSR